MNAPEFFMCPVCGKYFAFENDMLKCTHKLGKMTDPASVKLGPCPVCGETVKPCGCQEKKPIDYCELNHKLFSDKDDYCRVCGKPLNPDF